MNVKLGQVARIVRPLPQPDPNRNVGRTGFVDRICPKDNVVVIRFLKPDGDTDGAMYVPPDCLEEVIDPAWQQALEEHWRKERQEEVDVLMRRLEHQQTIERIADKYQMTVDAVLEIAAVVTGHSDTRWLYYG